MLCSVPRAGAQADGLPPRRRRETDLPAHPIPIPAIPPPRARNGGRSAPGRALARGRATRDPRGRGGGASLASGRFDLRVVSVAHVTPAGEPFVPALARAFGVDPSVAARVAAEAPTFVKRGVPRAPAEGMARLLERASGRRSRSCLQRRRRPRSSSSTSRASTRSGRRARRRPPRGDRACLPSRRGRARLPRRRAFRRPDCDRRAVHLLRPRRRVDAGSARRSSGCWRLRPGAGVAWLGFARMLPAHGRREDARQHAPGGDGPAAPATTASRGPRGSTDATAASARSSSRGEPPASRSTAPSSRTSRRAIATTWSSSRRAWRRPRATTRGRSARCRRPRRIPGRPRAAEAEASTVLRPVEIRGYVKDLLSPPSAYLYDENGYLLAVWLRGIAPRGAGTASRPGRTGGRLSRSEAR